MTSYLYRISCINDVQVNGHTHYHIWFGSSITQRPQNFFFSWKIEFDYANSVYLLCLTSKVLLSGEKSKLVLLSLTFNSNFRKETKCINTHNGVYPGSNRPSEQISEILTEILPAFHIHIISQVTKAYVTQVTMEA